VSTHDEVLIGSLTSLTVVSIFPISHRFCFEYGVYYPTWLLVLSASTDALLLLRVLALLKDRRHLRIGLKFLYASVYLVLAALLGYYYNILFLAPPNTTGPIENLGCVDTSYNGGTVLNLTAAMIPIACAPLLLLNTTLFVVVLCTVIPMARRREETVPLFEVLIRDGALYFAITTCSNMLLIIMALVYYNSPRSVSVAEPWFLSIAPMASCRLYLNLRASVPPPNKPLRGEPRSEERDETFDFTVPSSEQSAPAAMQDGPSGSSTGPSIPNEVQVSLEKGKGRE